MRSVDYNKCWPFAEERTGRSLPPIPTRRFRWWVDEMRTARSAGEAVDPVERAAVGVTVETRDGTGVDSADDGRGDGGDALELMKRKKQVKEGRKRRVREQIGATKKLKVTRKMMTKKKKLKVEIRAAKKVRGMFLRTHTQPFYICMQ
ncbi:hypothetical protein BHE74_00037323 [Ensete ventricosum]|nr:hypothetical protein GW17_00011886 [Ensete ventricosum]RWW55993.1 hypothetical protein BHE74_00037323 [Ensete ventricosum]